MGGSRKHTLEDSAGVLFFILLYRRIYPTMAVAGFLLGVARNRICDWVHTYQPVWEAVPGKRSDLPKRQARSMDEFLLAFPKVRRVVIDATERPRTRPKDPELRRMNYSGKKKRHTSKNAIVADPHREKILVLAPTAPGSVHDKRDITDTASFPILRTLSLWGYKGPEKEFEGIIIPDKKPRKSELTQAQKRRNRKKASSRGRVEHLIGLCKRYRCVSDVYRNRRKNFDDASMLTCCGLTHYYQRTAKRA